MNYYRLNSKQVTVRFADKAVSIIKARDKYYIRIFSTYLKWSHFGMDGEERISFDLLRDAKKWVENNQDAIASVKLRGV